MIACAKSKAAFREELALLVVGIPLAFVITGTREQDPLVKRVKGMGSAAILLSLVAAGVTWLWVLANRFWF